ncbi:MAG TPA: hypothetical protein PKA95_17335 [Thermomicrobiales bacterium]|nr:hypothetical protein [Thermomicrobiales bacterium]
MDGPWEQEHLRSSTVVDEWQANAMTNLAIACIVVPDFPLRIESVRHPELDRLPLALTDAADAPDRRLLARGGRGWG